MAREPKSPITIAQLKNEELYGIVLSARGESAPLSDTKIEQALWAAEDAYERDLQINWKPARVFSDVYGRQQIPIATGSVAELPADYDALKDLDEPAYDYDDRFYSHERNGLLQLNYRPVRRILKYFFAYPGTHPIYSVPKTWHRIDRKMGDLQLIPDAPASFATFSAFLMSRINGGMGLPQSVFVDYEIGFTADELEQHHQDLLQGLRLRTMLSLMGIISTIATGGQTGGSLSLDGLSRSRSFGGKYGAYSGQIELALTQEEAVRDSWKRREQGVPMVVA